MARDVCIDCEAHFPGGEGLLAGRCLTCHIVFKKREQEPAAESPDTVGVGPRDYPDTEEE